VGLGSAAGEDGKVAIGVFVHSDIPPNVMLTARLLRDMQGFGVP